MLRLHLFILCLIIACLVRGQNALPVDFLSADIQIQIDPRAGTMKGDVRYQLQVIQNTDSVSFDAVRMDFSSVLLNGKKVRHNNSGQSLTLYKRLKAGKHFEITMSYSVKPEQTVYFVGWDDTKPENNQVWTQGQGKETSRWLPSFNNMSEKVVFNLAVSFDPAYEVIANGQLSGTKMDGGLKVWEYKMTQPMSSYLLAFAIGKYSKDSLQMTNGTKQYLYYYPADSLSYEPTFRYSSEIFDFLEKEIGVPYPWQNYKQVPVSDFLYAGMENTGTTLFSDGYVIDSVSFIDRNYVNINAHELAHQWFGDLVTERSSADHWLHEGFATYFAYRTEKMLFGDDYFYWKLFDTAQAIDQFTRESGGEALTNPRAGSLTFYEKGAWALFILEDLVGEKAFHEGIRNFLHAYSYNNATVDQFLAEMEKAAGRELNSFKAEWLENEGFPMRLVLDKLGNSCTSLKQFMDLQREMTVSPEADDAILMRYWENSDSPEMKEALVRTYFGSLPETLIKKAFNSNDIKIRQALVLRTAAIPSSLKEEYESLLYDQSFVTMEAALYKLWIYFDGDRSRYLDETRESYGLPNRNVRLLWLTLALLTPGYDTAHTQDYYRELCAYTSPEFSTETRQLAFEYLKEAFPFTDQNLKDLIKATVHHSWQFRSFSRKLLDTLYQKGDYRDRLSALAGELSEADLRYLRQKLDSK